MLILLATAFASLTYYSPIDDCAADAFPLSAWTPPPSFPPELRWSCVRAWMPRIGEQDLLWVNQAFTSHADPCFMNGIAWASFNTSSTGGIIFTAQTPATLAIIKGCLRSIVYRNLALRPCYPYPWSGYAPTTITTSTCDDKQTFTETSEFGRRALYLAASTAPEECSGDVATLDSGPFGANYVVVLPASNSAKALASRPGGNCAV